jgi:hypothetical protein
LKTNKFWVILLCGLLLVSAVLAFTLRRTPGNTASIYSDGELVRQLDLSAVAEPYTITVECETGMNVIAVEKGRIRILTADCHDGSCVRQGWISGGATPIVCLPHHLVIQLENVSAADVDAVAG